jgi:hypothetical protein
MFELDEPAKLTASNLAFGTHAAHYEQGMLRGNRADRAPRRLRYHAAVMKANDSCDRRAERCDERS